MLNASTATWHVLKRLLVLLFIFHLPAQLLSQFDAQKADSLKSALLVANSPLEKIDLLFVLQELYEYEDAEQAKRYLFDALEIAEEEGLIFKISACKSFLSKYYLASNNWDTIVLLNQQGLDLIKGKGVPEGEAKHLSYLANAAEERRQYSQAIEYNMQALSLTKNSPTQMIIHNNLGNIYNDLNYYDKAVFHLLEAKTIAEEIMNIYGSSAISTNIGHTYASLGQYEKAREYFAKAIELKGELGDEFGKIYGLIGLADLHRQIEEYELSIETYEEALAIARKFGNTRMELIILNRIGGNYINLNDHSSAIDMFNASLTIIRSPDSQEKYPQEANVYHELSRIYNRKKEHRKALEHAQKALVSIRSTQEEVSPIEIQSLYQLAQAYHHLGRSNLAYETILEYNVLHDSLQEIRNLKETQTLELKYNVSEKEKEMALLEAEKNAEIQTQKTTNRFFGILSLIAFVAAILLFFFLRQRTRQQQQLQIQHQQISEQNQTIVQQSEELQQLDALKSRLFANVSHELRTPLTLILGPLSSALKSSNLDSKTNTFLRLAQQNGQKLLQLINEILDLSKMDAGKLDLNEKPVLLLPFLERMLAQFESHAEDRGVALNLYFEPDPHTQVLLDAHKFEIVFNNLLSNAIKFTPRQGRVSVSLEHHGNDLALVVTDTGPGIPEKDVPHIFDRFYQSNQSESQAGGTGIGLALCKEYARLFGGDIQAQNLPDRGAGFRFSFPRKEVLGTIDETPSLVAETVADIHTVEEVALASTNAARHLLLVEDNYSLRSYIRTVLGDQYQITTAENGQVALDILQASADHIDLIISDVMMPVMDGFQFLEHLKAHEQWRNIPVVMLTARAELKDKLKALRIGVDDYMTKPFDEEELLVRIHNLLQHAEQRSQPPVWEAEEEQTESVEPEVEESQGLSEEDQAWLEKVESITKASIVNLQFGVDDLAYDMAASRRNFHRKLKSMTGLTPNNYLLEVRLQQARFLLETRQVSSVKATALEVGFKDNKYFSQKFKSRFGKLPSEYLVA